MMMDTAIQQQTDPNGQALVTTHERQVVLQRLRVRWSPDLAARVESQAYEKSRGVKAIYGRFVQMYFQQVQAALQNRNNQQQQQQTAINNTMTFSNPPQQQVQPQQSNPISVMNPMVTQTPRFPSSQPTPRMANPIVNSTPSLREPPKFNPTPTGTITTTMIPSFSQSSSTAMDVSQVYPSQRMNNPNSTDYSSLQPRFPNIPRQRAPIPPSNPASLPIANPNTSSSGDQLLQRILSTTIDGGANSMTVPNRSSTVQPVLSQAVRQTNPVSNNPNNSTNLIRPSQPQLSPSPSVVVIPTQPLSNIPVQQSPLNNNSQPISSASSSPINRSILSTGSAASDDEILNLVKYFKENVNRLQILIQKYTNDGNNDKFRQVQAIHQQILQFITNPTVETLNNAKHFRDMLERIPNRQVPQPVAVQPPPPPTTTNVFNQCLKATSDFLSRDQKERINVMKRYLEPLNDVINGVPHKIMRLDLDQSPPIKLRSFNEISFLTELNEELNQLPNDLFSIERIYSTRFHRTIEEQPNRNGLILRCRLIEKYQPIIPSLRLLIPTSYPEQPPEILSLTKTIPPRLEFTDGHPFFDQLSLIFVSHVFKLRPKHTVTEILHIWRLSVQTAL